MPQNQTSLLSTFQVRESGHKVNDIASRHGGTQEITADGFNIPLFIHNGLLGLKIRIPTENEITNCTRIVLTNDQPWNPEELSSLNKTTTTTILPNYNSSYCSQYDSSTYIDLLTKSRALSITTTTQVPKY